MLLIYGVVMHVGEKVSCFDLQTMDDVGGSDKDTGLVPNMLITDEFPRVIVLRYTIGGETIDIRVSRRGMWGWEPNRNLIGYMVSGDLHVHFVPDAHDLLHNRKG